MAFMQRWLENHWKDSNTIVRKPLVFSEFGKTKKDSGYSESARVTFLSSIYTNIYDLARNGALGGGMVWQIMAEGMDSYYDGYEIVLSQSPLTTSVIALQSRKMTALEHI